MSFADLVEHRLNNLPAGTKVEQFYAVYNTDVAKQVESESFKAMLCKPLHVLGYEALCELMPDRKETLSIDDGCKLVLAISSTPQNLFLQRPENEFMQVIHAGWAEELAYAMSFDLVARNRAEMPTFRRAFDAYYEIRRALGGRLTFLGMGGN